MTYYPTMAACGDEGGGRGVGDGRAGARRHVEERVQRLHRREAEAAEADGRHREAEGAGEVLA